MNKMFQGFKDFIMRGNVVDLAVGIVIGAAFTTVVNSFVNDLLMPPIGRLIGGVSFTNLFLSLDGQRYPSLAAARSAGAPTLNYGVFFTVVINFLIVGFAVFLVVRAVNRLFAAPPPPVEAPTTRDCPACTIAIPRRASRCPHCTTEVQPIP